MFKNYQNTSKRCSELTKKKLLRSNTRQLDLCEVGGVCGLHQIPRPPHHLGSDLVTEHLRSDDEGPTKNLLPQETEESGLSLQLLQNM